MNRMKYTFAAVGAFLLIVLVGSWISTELVAGYFRYHSMLGRPIFHIGATSVYWPWAFLKWLLAFQERIPRAFEWQLLPCFSSILLGTAVSVVINRFGLKKSEDGLRTHGSARWANTKDIEKAGLFAKSGVMLGLSSDKKKYLRHDGPEHICVFAPTRSGKGVGIVCPTLIGGWTDGSVVCHDPKGELWKLTSGFRSKFSRCIYFDPSSLQSARFNPLSEVRLGHNEVKDAQNIADMLVDPDGAERRQSHWERTAHALLVGAILHVLYIEKDKTLSGLANFLADPNRTMHETLKTMLNAKHLGDRTHPVVASSARELLNKASEELSGVVSTAVSFLSLYRDPVVAQATSASDFKVRDLVGSKHPVSLYLVVAPSDISRTKPLMRLILNQIGRILTESLESQNKHRLLLMLDEFPALGRLDFFESALAYIAGYGIKAVLITQSLNQIESIYGANNSILDNCHIRIAFAANDERTAKRISELVGCKTAVKEQNSMSGKNGSLLPSNHSVSFQEFSRPLLTPSEVNQLPADEQIILVAGSPPILAKKLRYYEDVALKARILPPVVLEKANALVYAAQPITAKEAVAEIESESDVNGIEINEVNDGTVKTESEEADAGEDGNGVDLTDMGTDRNIRGMAL